MIAYAGMKVKVHSLTIFLNQPKVSRHLAYLKRAGLVADRMDGLWVHYRLAEPLANHARQLIGSLRKLKLNVVNCAKGSADLAYALSYFSVLHFSVERSGQQKNVAQKNVR
jgi:hypothetical protein